MDTLERKVDIKDLQSGMYVARLDRPWLETPFPFQGFYIRSQRTIDELRRRCRFVYIDTERGVSATRYLKTSDERTLTRQIRSVCTGPALRPDRYEQIESFESELQTAKEQHSQLGEVIRNAMDDVRAGRKLSALAVRKGVTGMVESVLRNPDAFLWLSRLKEVDSYTYDHAIACCTLAVALGRHLGFSKRDLTHLAVGTLLFDIGKMKVPQALFSRTGRLSPKEFALIKEHVRHSVALLENTNGMDPLSVETCRYHHERHDGSGYLDGLRADHIPICGRIAGLVDCYDAITSQRPYQAPLSPHAAIHSLYEWRDVDFQAELVEQFIQCLGVYPTGTLVELTTGQVGFVLAQNRVRRLRPKIMLVLDEHKKPYGIAPTIDLMVDSEDNNGIAPEIRCALDPGAYNIDPREFYL